MATASTNALTGTLRRVAAPLLIVALVIGAAVVLLGGGDGGQKKLTAYFPRTVSLYEGSDVRVLGVRIGTVDSVVPEGDKVRVEMTYDADVKIPSRASAVIIAPSIVGDRYIQLTPAYKSGEELEDNASLDMARTEVPLELDDIYASLDRLTVALGPTGANRTGALTDLLQVTAANFSGQGEKFNQTVRDFATLSQTLDDNKDELFGATAELQQFITTLADNDDTVQQFNDSLGRVSGLLADERDDLATALRNLGVALDEVGGFVAENRDLLGKNITGLNRVVQVLVRQRDNLAEVLRTAPVALNNLALTYNPDTGTLDTNANIGNLEKEIANNPTLLLCSLLAANDPNGRLCDLVDSLGLPRTSPFGPGTGTSVTAESDPSLGGILGRSK
ncbi:MCE family protein [Nocardioides sp.]|uniref:MCE family protein n=1 Tax=Nocardioides sp. TaxID=35761 RepID=UPI003518BFA4